MTQQTRPLITITIIYATPGNTRSECINLAKHSTLSTALNHSTLVRELTGFTDTLSFGIYGKRAKPDQLLKDGDRIEIYRPLLIDPKEIRRKRAQKSS